MNYPTDAIADAAERVRRMAEWEDDVRALAAATDTPTHYVVRDPLPSADALADLLGLPLGSVSNVRYADDGDILFDCSPYGVTS